MKKAADRPIIEAGDYWRRSWPDYEALRRVDQAKVLELRAGQQAPVFSENIEGDSGRRRSQ